MFRETAIISSLVGHNIRPNVDLRPIQRANQQNETKRMKMRRLQILLLGSALALSACGGGPDAATSMQKAQDHYAKGDFSAARVEIMNVLAADPKNAAAHILNAKNALELADGVGAEHAVTLARQNGASEADTQNLLLRSWLQQMLPLKVLGAVGRDAGDEDDAEIYLLRGEAYQAINRADKAQEQWEAGLELEPEDPELLVNVARLKYQDKDVEGAKELAAQASAANPKHPDVMMLNGDLALFSGDAAGALPWFEKLVAAYPSDLKAKLGKAAALNALGRKKEALALADQVLKVDAKSPVATMMKAEALADQGKYAEAQKLIDGTVVFFRNSPLAYRVRGEIASEKGLTDTAILNFERALAGEPGNKAYRARLAKELTANGEMDKADEIMQGAVSDTAPAA